MKRNSCLLLIISTCLLPQLHAADPVSIRDEPSGKRLLFIDGKDVRTEPNGKRLLFIDDQSLRDSPNGKRLMFIDGDNVRPDPHGIRLAFIDGKNIRRNPNGKRLLFIDDKNIREEPNSKRLFFIDGEISKAQLIAALYILKPELFKLTEKEEAALKAAMKEAEAESEKEFSNVHIGKFDVLNSTNPEWGRGVVSTVKGKDDFLYLDLKLKNQAMNGIGIRRPGEAWEEWWIAFAPEGSVALAVYDIDGGKLTGSWIPINAAKDGKGKLGSEVLDGPANLDGDFKILEGKAPNEGAAYTGTVSIHPFQPNENGSDLFDIYSVTWTFGDVKIPGVAAKVKSTPGKFKLIAASGTKADFAVGHVTGSSATQSKGIDYMTNKGSLGYIVWTKQNE